MKDIRERIRKILKSCFTECVDGGFEDCGRTKFGKLEFKMEFDKATKNLMQIVDEVIDEMGQGKKEKK